MPHLRAGAAFLHRTLRPGLTERQAADALRAFFRPRGHRNWAFRFIIAAGPSAAEPHHAPGRRRLKRGDMVVCDFGLRIRHTATDMTRTFLLGPPSRKLRHAYQSVLAAQHRATRRLKPGAAGAALDALARRSLDRAGFRRQFIHGLGHGVGYNIHEPPWLSPRKKSILRSGDVVTVEPGVYRKDWGGIRIEDMYLITRRGSRQLTRVPSSLASAIIPV